jgi:hypothetical protein
MERRSIDIGGGVSLEAVVAGDGPVTVVFENGLGTPLEEWDAVAPHVAQRTRTLRYDRRSAVPSGPVGARTAADMAADLRDCSRLSASSRRTYSWVIAGEAWSRERSFEDIHPRSRGWFSWMRRTKSSTRRALRSSR